MMLVTLASFSNDADSDYDRCFRSIPCKHDDLSPNSLPEKERKKVMECRIGRHLKCSQPEKDVVIDPVLNYLRALGYEVKEP